MVLFIYSMQEMVPVIISVILVLLFLGLMFLISLVYYNNKKKKLIMEKKAIQASFQQELLKSQLEIQEANFKNISQEIHDNIGQALSFIKLNINTIDITEQQAAREKLIESKNLLTKVIQDLRDLSRTLNPDFIKEIGLLQAIEQQINFLKKSGLYKAEMNITGIVEKYPLQKELVVFRIVQELLNNIVKHADATSIRIHMDYQDSQLLITVEDNGKGFDTAAQKENNASGLGLRNMHNRMTLINGLIRIDSEKGKGTFAAIHLPKEHKDGSTSV